MKIGIITFHWATNYGAVLQCYALQETLKMMGHEVYVINYKPKKYDNTLWNFLRFRKFMSLSKYFKDINKERLIESFRKKYLNVTNRYYSLKELQVEYMDFDVIISGSDQVLNASFLIGGESRGSTAYFLDFGKESVLRICYAVSFGTTKYPTNLVAKIKPLVNRFTFISTREKTGLEIFEELGRKDVFVVPDPTLLLNSVIYKKLIRGNTHSKKCFVYLLHNRYNILKDKLSSTSIVSSSESIEDWLRNISEAEWVVTNSFHGTVFCILFHVPFYVVLPTLENKGMNDRFYTLLSILNLTDRMCLESNFKYSNTADIDWDIVDGKLEKYREIGLSFLQQSLNL